MFNPLYVHAGVGPARRIFASHYLLATPALSARCSISPPKILYGFVWHAPRPRSPSRRLRGIDVLVIDDLQLQGKSTQAEFRHTSMLD
jgi:hypothetical protein